MWLVQVRRVDDVMYAVDVENEHKAEWFARDAIAYDRALAALVAWSPQTRAEPPFRYSFGIWRGTGKLSKLAWDALTNADARAVLADAIEEKGHPVVADAIRANHMEAIRDVITEESTRHESSDVDELETVAHRHRLRMLVKPDIDDLWVRGANQFAKSYIDAAFWATNDESDERGGEPLDANYDVGDLAPETLVRMLRDARGFQVDNAEDLAESGLSDDQAGHDFWLTRHGHGTGFWDRGLGDVGDRLAEAARAYGSFDLYVGDDGRIYGS